MLHGARYFASGGFESIQDRVGVKACVPGKGRRTGSMYQPEIYSIVLTLMILSMLCWGPGFTQTN
jgi:hypothetical protein